MQKTTPQNAKVLAESTGWEIYEYDPTNYWTMSFHKPDVAAIWVRFSPNGMLTKVDASDFVNQIHSRPTRDKSTRLSHYLTEGIN